MTAADLLNRAAHALRTEQPNLAMLYMRRAAELIAADRAAIKQDYRTARIMANPAAALKFAGQDIADAFIQLSQGMIETLRIIAPNLVRLAESTQADYTLAGPSMGGGA